MEVQTQFETRTGQQQAEQRQPLQAGDDQTVGIAEQDGGGFHPDLQIVLAVGHGVVGIVGHRPQQIGDVQQPGFRRQAAGFGGEGHRHAPGKSRTEHHLRVEGVALHEGVAGRQRQAAERQPDGGGVGEQHQHETHRHQHGEQQQCLARLDLATGQRTRLRSADVAIEVAVGVVVDHAASGTHQDHADDEDEQVLRARHAFGCHPQRPQGRPQQQIDADRLVQAHQLDEVPSARVQAGGRLQQAGVHRSVSVQVARIIRANSSTEDNGKCWERVAVIGRSTSCIHAACRAYSRSSTPCA